MSEQIEWRDMGLDEVIQEGDERTDSRHGLAWRKVENSIGTQPKKWPTLKFRTRRPLPKLKLTRECYDEGWILKSKQGTENEVARLRKENNEFLLSEAALLEELKICDDWLVHTRNENARLRELLEAAYGLCQGYDWNNGTHAKTHGYKRKVLEAVHALKPVVDIEGKRYSFGGTAPAPLKKPAIPVPVGWKEYVRENYPHKADQVDNFYDLPGNVQAEIADILGDIERAY
jgi:hypothetical protein